MNKFELDYLYEHPSEMSNLSNEISNEIEK